MRRIIQIDESEYNQLVDKANLNEKQIEEKAVALYEEKGVAKIELTVRTKSDSYYTVTFNCDAWVWYKDERFFISEELRDRLRSFIAKHVQNRINKDYEKPQELIADYNRKIFFFSYLKYVFYVIAASGWGVAVSLWFLK